MEEQDALLKAVQAMESAKSAHKRIDTIEKEVSDIHELAAAMAKVNTKVDGIINDMGEIKTEVKKVSDRPRIWWDKLIAAAIGAIATGIVGAILSVILIK